MNESRFDDLSRRLATATSRRAVFKTLVAGMAGLAGSWLSHENALAKPCMVNSDCASTELCCSRQCISRSDEHCEACNRACASNEHCCHGTCSNVLNSPEN